MVETILKLCYTIDTKNKKRGNRMTVNLDIKEAAKAKNVYLWEVAEALGIVDTSMSRKLRHELPEQEKQRIFEIIEKIAAEKSAAVAV